MKHTLLALLTLLLLLPAGRVVAQEEPGEISVTAGGPIPVGKPIELSLNRAGSTALDLRNLPKAPPKKRERPEREEPEIEPTALPGVFPPPSAPGVPERSAPAPSPAANFLGLDFNTWGAGHPPDPVGDVGPTYYIQAVNTSIGIFQKSNGSQVAAFTFDTFMSQGNFGNLCDTDNFGDPVVLYDTFEDRWVITDFAFQLDGSGNVINPPAVFQCIAVSKTGDPVAGGWNFYSLHITDALNDYPKFGIWPDGIYMSANLFGLPANGSFINSRVWAFNKAQMYAGSPTVQVVSFNAPSAEFTLLPANARLQTGTPPAGSPNYYSVVWQFINAVSVYKFHVDWNSISLSSFTGPSIAIAPASWANAPANVPSMGGSNNDTLAPRLMMQNQYTNLGGVESLWDTHTVLGGAAATAAPRWYQTVVTGGTVAATTTQAATHTPDTTVNRYMPSLAIDRAGDMMMGYSASSSTLQPAIRYAGRLSTDPVNTLPQTETTLVAGTGAQTGTTRWGDYSAMSLDPDGCTFWYTNEYYITTGVNWQTRVGSFSFPSCTPVTNGTVQGTVTATAGGAPISGATVALGSRTTTTDGSGVYTFSAIPSGTYPSITASAPGYTSVTATNIVVTDGGTTTQNFSLATAATSACPTDTSQADFQTGVPTNLDLTASPGNARLANPPVIDQQNTTLGTQGAGFTNTTWLAQTFTAAVTGPVVRIDLNLFSLNCAAVSMPNLTVAIRNASGNLPTGADLAVATIPGFCNGAGGFFTATFASPVTLTAGTQYAVVWRATAAIPTGTPAPGYFGTVSAGTGTVSVQNPYAGGRRASSANSGSTWTGATGNANNDHGFIIYVDHGFALSGDLISSLKDSNPPAGYTPTWTTLSWTATTPTNTTVRFQAAASNSAGGPFNFVGPDGTAATFYTTSGGSLSQFNGKRYLRYRAYLSTTDNTVTPTLSDVTVCFVDLAPAPDLSLTKSDGGASVSPGGTVAYTLTYATLNATAVTGVVLTETVPANSTFNAGASTAGWVCTPNGSAGSTCTLAVGALAGNSGNQTATFAVTVVNPVAAGVTQISNTASIADDGTHGADSTPGNNTGSDTTPVIAAPDFSLTKSDGGASVAPGGTVAYILTYANSGNRGATGVVLAETVPANTTFNAGASTAGWACVPNGNAGSTCTLAIGGLAAGGGNQTATFAVTAVNPLPAGVTQISNTASIADNGTNGTDPTPGNNTGSDTTPLTGAPDFSLTKSDGGVSVAPGGTVAYTLTYANAGNRGATGVVLSETVPANTTFNAGASTAGWVCTPNGNAGSTCTLAVGALAAGGGNQTATFAVTVTNPVPGGVTQISNTASIADDGANGTDPTPGNNTGSDTTPLSGAPDLSLTKSDGGASVAPGGTVAYTLSYTNSGSIGATGVVITETVPANTTFSAGASTAGWVCTPNGNAGSTCTLAIGTVAGGGGAHTATFAVTVVNPVPAGVTQIANTASIGDDGTNGTDPTPANNTGSDTTPLSGAPDLSLTKSDGGASVAPGGTVAYTLTYANSGNRGASGVVITETVPANTTFSAGASTAGWACVPNGNAGSTCTLAVGTVAGGGGAHTATFAVTVVNPVAAGVTQISNTASIADNGTNGTDPTPGNNTGSDTTPLSGAPDFSLTKSDGGASVAPGGTVAYTLTYANAGNRGATGVVITETVPANTTFNSGASTAGWVCAPNGNAGSTCTLGLGSLAAGGGNQTATFAVTVVNPVAAGVTQISNTASIADNGTNGTDPTPANNTGSDTTPLTGAPDLSLTKSDGGVSVAPGGTAAYTLTYANAGNRGATGVVITETVPANTTFNAGASTAGWVCVPNGNAGSTCTLAIGAVVAGGGNHTATFAVTVVNPVPGGVTQISNTASIADDGTNGTDPTPGNNTGSDTTPVSAAPDLSLTKSDGGASVAPGGTVAYTLTYANAGSIGATGVVITETVPTNTTFNAGASTAGWVCTPNGNAGSTCTLAIGAVAAGGGAHTATFAVTVVNPLPAGVTQIANTAIIADDGTNGTDPTPGNNAGSDTTPVTGAPDLSITKSDGGATAVPAGSISYTLTYANSGSHNATGVVITETVPAHTKFVPGASTAGWSCTPDNNAGATCTLAIGALAAGSGNQTATFAVTVDNPLAASVTQIANTATIADDGANGTDPTPGNNTGSDTTPVLNGLFYAVTPCRLVDTRNATGPYGGPAIAALSTRTFVAAGQCGIPADAKALSFNIAVTLSTTGGDLRLYPTGATVPLVAVINYSTDQTRTNNGIVVLGAAGDFVVKSDQPTGTVHLIIDLNGYFQ